MASAGSAGPRRGPGLPFLLALGLPLAIGSCVEDADPAGLDIPTQVTVDLTPALSGDLANTPASLALHWALVEATFTGAEAELAEAVVALNPDAPPTAVQVRFDLLSEMEVTLEGTVELVREAEGENESVEWAAFFGPFTVDGTQANWEFPVTFGRGNLAEQAITDLVVTGDEGPVVEGGVLELSATTEGGPEGARVFWGSSNPEVATVDGEGTVTTHLPGTTSITAAAGPHARSVGVQVLQAVAELVVTPDTVIVTSVEDAVVFTAQALDPRGAPVTDRVLEVSWSAQNPLVATSLGDGAFQPAGSGVTQVIAEADGLQAEATLIVELGVGSLLMVEGDGQSGTVGGALDPFVVRVVDESGVPVPGTTVEWLVTQGSGELSQAITVSDGDGLAESVYTLGTTAGTQGVRARVQGTFLQVDFSVTAVAGGAAALVVMSGNGQDGQAGEPLAEPLVVRVEDQYGNPVPDTTVVWGTEFGSVDPAAVLTGEDGLASTTWTVGGGLGEQTASASLAELEPAIFQANVGPGAPAGVFAVSGDGQEAGVEEPLPEPLVVEVIDAFENSVPGVEVAWSVGSGTIDPAESVTGEDGRTQAVWTLGEAPGTVTATATVEGLEPAEFTAEAIPADPFIRLELVEEERIGVDREVTLRATLAPEADPDANGVLVEFTVDDPTRLELGQQSVLVPPGMSVGEVTVTGLNAGNTTIRATAAGYLDGALPVEVTFRIISLPSTLNVALGGTASIPVQLAEPAPPGGIEVTLESGDPAVVGIATPTVTVPAGLLTANGTVSGVALGTAVVTASHPDYVAGVSQVSATAALQIVQGSLTINESFGGTIQIRLTSGGSTVAAPEPGVTIDLTADDPACVAIPGQVTIAAGLSQISADVEWAGEAETQCQATVTASAPDIDPDQINVTVNPVPGVTFAGATSAQTGSGLQRSRSGSLGASNHGGVTVTLTSGDPETLLLAPNASTAGTASIEVPVNAGATSFSYWIQGVEGATAEGVTVTATAPGFNEGTTSMEVREPALDLISVPTSITTLSPQSAIYVRVGIASGSGVTPLQLRAGAPAALVATIANSNALAGQLVKTDETGQSLTVEILPGQSNSPTSVAGGGMAFDPLGAGESTVTASIPNHIQTPNAIRDVVVSAPNITFAGATSAQTGSGLQRSRSGSLGASNHGGVTVTLTSGDPETLLLAPNASTTGTASIEVPVNAGATSFSYWIQGVEGATAEGVTVTAMAPGFNEGTTSMEVREPALDLISVPTSITTLSPQSAIYVRVGIASGSGVTPLQLRAGAPAALVATIANSNALAGQLVKTDETGQSLTVEILPGQSNSPTSVAGGGMAFDPLGAGESTVTASIPNHIQTPNAIRDVVVSAPNITFAGATSAQTGSGLQRSRSGSLGASEHGGVTVTLTSSNPAVLLLAPNASTAGTASIEVPVNAGATSFSYWIQGVEGATAEGVTVTATAPGFNEGTTSMEVREPALDLISVPTSITTLSPQSAIYVRVGIASGSGVTPLQLRAGAPAALVATIANSNALAGQLVKTDETGQSLTVEILPGQSNSPTSVAGGGMAFDPLGAGESTVTASIPNHIQTPNAIRDVVVSAPNITFAGATSAQTGSGLQRSRSGSLGASEHGGVTVTLTSSNPAVLLLAPNASTAGTASIEVPVNAGATSFSYWIQGVEGAEGIPTVTASASGFVDGSATMEVMAPALDLISVPTSMTAGAPPSAFYARVGVPSGAGVTPLQLRAGGPGPLTVTMTNTDAAVGRLMTTEETGQALTVQINPGQSNSPTSLAGGGIAFEPIGAGQTSVSGSVPGFIQTTNAVRSVTVNEP
jgi:hypothetical protein